MKVTGEDGEILEDIITYDIHTAAENGISSLHLVARLKYFIDISVKCTSME